jgi:ADP-dependent glucokinase
VSSLEDFDKLLKEFNPNLLVVSGLQMMDNYPYPEGKKVHNFREGVKITVLWSPVVTIKFELVANFFFTFGNWLWGMWILFH